MKKCLIVTICMIALAGTSIASAENAGIGFEWSVGPQYPLVPYYSSVVGFSNNFVLSWPVGDVTLGVFGENVRVRASRSYTILDQGVTPNTTTKYTVINSGSMTNAGISLTTLCPSLDFLRFGIELGSSTISTSNVYWANGTVGLPAQWGTAPAAGVVATGMVPLAGLMTRWSLMNSKAKGIWTEVSLQANLRFVPMPDTYPMGTKEAIVQTGAPANAQGFEPMTNFNHLNLVLGVTIGF